MCLSCEMAAAWFAEMEAQRAAAPPDQASAHPPSAAPPGSADDGARRRMSAGEDIVEPNAAQRSFVCESTNRQ